MSTAIDFGALMRRAKAKKSSASNRASTHEQGSLASSESDCKLVRRPENADSLEREYKVSPEGLERAFYVPNFVSAEEESYLLEKIYKGEEEEERSGKWVSLSHRRLMVFGGTPDAQGTLKRALPTWMDAFIDNCVNPFLKGTPPIDDFKKFDHVLLNEYSQGSGIAPHLDGPLYDSRVCVLNLQSRAVISFYKEEIAIEKPSSLSSNHQSTPLTVDSNDHQSHPQSSESKVPIKPSSTEQSSNQSETLIPSTTKQDEAPSPSPSSLHANHQSHSTADASSTMLPTPKTPSPTLKEVFCLVLEPRSLLIFEGALYKDYKHGIANAKEDDLRGRTIANASSFFLSSDSLDSIASSSLLSRGNLPRLSLTIRSIKNRSERSVMDAMATREEAEEIRRSEVQFYRNVSEIN